MIKILKNWCTIFLTLFQSKGLPLQSNSESVTIQYRGKDGFFRLHNKTRIYLKKNEQIIINSRFISFYETKLFKIIGVIEK